jgi:lactoylglutathione lyase
MCYLLVVQIHRSQSTTIDTFTFIIAWLKKPNPVNKSNTMSSSKEIYFGNALYKVFDLKVARKFYSKTFGVKTYFDEPTWVIFEVGGNQLWLVPADSTEEHPEVYGAIGKPDCEFIYWKVKDINAVFQKFIDFGGAVHKRIRRDGPFMEAIVEDLWGNKLGLCQDLFE